MNAIYYYYYYYYYYFNYCFYYRRRCCYYFTERLDQIDSLTARLNILLSDFADLIADLDRLHHSSAATAAVPRYSSDRKRNTFDQLAVGGRFG